MCAINEELLEDELDEFEEDEEYEDYEEDEDGCESTGKSRPCLPANTIEAQTANAMTKLNKHFDHVEKELVMQRGTSVGYWRLRCFDKAPMSNKNPNIESICYLEAYLRSERPWFGIEEIVSHVKILKNPTDLSKPAPVQMALFEEYSVEAETSKGFFESINGYAFFKPHAYSIAHDQAQEMMKEYFLRGIKGESGRNEEFWYEGKTDFSSCKPMTDVELVDFCLQTIRIYPDNNLDVWLDQRHLHDFHNQYKIDEYGMFYNEDMVEFLRKVTGIKAVEMPSDDEIMFEDNQRHLFKDFDLITLAKKGEKEFLDVLSPMLKSSGCYGCSGGFKDGYSTSFSLDSNPAKSTYEIRRSIESLHYLGIDPKLTYGKEADEWGKVTIAELKGGAWLKKLYTVSLARAGVKQSLFDFGSS